MPTGTRKVAVKATCKKCGAHFEFRSNAVASRCPECQSKRHKGPHDPAKHRKANLRRRYRMTVAEYDDRLAAQGGVCAVCGGDKGDVPNFHVDHCHRTGAVRGLLCSRCNRGLGFFGDDTKLMASAISYLLAAA